MKTSRIIQFIAAAALVSIGCVGMLEHWRILSSLCMPWAPMVLMSRAELTRPVPRREGWGSLAVFLLFLAVIVVPCFFIPDRAVERVVCHPAFDIPFWALLLLGLFWRWRRERKMTGA
jgi:hypothetical protein